MKKSIILALLIVVIVVGWLLSGLWRGSDQLSVNQGTGSGAAASAELAHASLPRVRVRSITAERTPQEIILLVTIPRDFRGRAKTRLCLRKKLKKDWHLRHCL